VDDFATIPTSKKLRDEFKRLYLADFEYTHRDWVFFLPAETQFLGFLQARFLATLSRGVAKCEDSRLAAPEKSKFGNALGVCSQPSFLA
jgi:hypothetical protein